MAHAPVRNPRTALLLGQREGTASPALTIRQYQLIRTHRAVDLPRTDAYV